MDKSMGSRGPSKEWPGWMYFKSVTQENSSEVITYCCLPQCTYSNKGRNTTTLTGHLKRQHIPEFDNIESKRRKWNDVMPQQKLENFFLKDSSNWKNHCKSSISCQKEKEIDTAVARFFALPTVSINSSQSPQFQHLMEIAFPDYKIKCRETISKAIAREALQVKANVKQTLQANTSSKVSLAIDIWTAPGMSASFMGLVACSYNTTANKLQTVLLSVKEFPSPHTADAIRTWVRAEVEKWGLEEKQIMRYLTDNASNCIAAFRQEKESFLIDKGHVANNDVSETEDVDDDSDTDDNEEQEAVLNITFGRRISCTIHSLMCALRATVDCPTSSVATLKRQVFALVNRFRHSVSAQQSLMNSPANVRHLKLISPSATRWNVCYLVFNRITDLKESVKQVCEEHDWPIEFQWSQVDLLRSLLEPFYCRSVELQADKTITSSRVRVVTTLLDVKTSRTWYSRKFRDLAPLPTLMLREIDRRFTHIINIDCPTFDPTFLIACMFDPNQAKFLPAVIYEAGKRHLQALVTSMAEIQQHEPDVENTGVEQVEEDVKESMGTLQARQPKSSTGRNVHEPMKELHSQISRYFEVLDTQERTASDTFLFWEESRLLFSRLFDVAIDFLSIPASSACVERAFSITGLTTAGRRGGRAKQSLIESEAILSYNIT